MQATGLMRPMYRMRARARGSHAAEIARLGYSASWPLGSKVKSMKHGSERQEPGQ